ncbi:MAG: citrate synthase/methylcitrate synthase, partial [Anaerolineales bacterium]|nr:citrate synthase/methylcitrate synthase [Anaerolineales bacterium]
MAEIARGLEGIVVCETRLSRVDGEAGELTIAGFPLEELAPNATFEEVLFLLWSDRLPTAQGLLALRQELSLRRPLAPASLQMLEISARLKIPPMDALRMAVDAIGTCEGEPHRPPDLPDVGCGIALTAPMPTIVAAYWRLLHGQEPIAPDPAIGHAANFLYMLEGKLPPADKVRALETYLNTVVDHGMNASTFTARVIASTRSDMLSAVVGGIGALKGPLHGGAPGPALDMVFEIRARAARSGKSVAEEADAWVRETMQSGGRIMGFGHRVYKVRDPRANVLALAAEKLFAGAGSASLYEDARTVEQATLRVLEELKPGRNLQTNVEFYTALVLHGIGLEVELFTPTFAISRVGGWTAHVLEQIKEDRLIRPQSVYVGP